MAFLPAFAPFAEVPLDPAQGLHSLLAAQRRKALAKALRQIGPIDAVERLLVLNAHDGVSLEPYIRPIALHDGVQTSYGEAGLMGITYAGQCW